MSRHCIGYKNDAVGCADESNNNEDTDLDGYKGIYQYDIDESQGIRISQNGDLYPNDEHNGGIPMATDMGIILTELMETDACLSRFIV